MPKWGGGEGGFQETSIRPSGRLFFLLSFILSFFLLLVLKLTDLLFFQLLMFKANIKKKAIKKTLLIVYQFCISLINDMTPMSVTTIGLINSLI